MKWYIILSATAMLIKNAPYITVTAVSLHFHMIFLKRGKLVLTVMFSRSRCLLWTVSQSLRIFSLILFMSFSLSNLEEESCSSSKSRIIKSKLALSRSMFKRSLLKIYIKAAVQSDKFFGKKKKKRTGKRSKPLSRRTLRLGWLFQVVFRRAR